MRIAKWLKRITSDFLPLSFILNILKKPALSWWRVNGILKIQIKNGVSRHSCYIQQEAYNFTSLRWHVPDSDVFQKTFFCEYFISVILFFFSFLILKGIYTFFSASFLFRLLLFFFIVDVVIENNASKLKSKFVASLLPFWYYSPIRYTNWNYFVRK